MVAKTPPKRTFLNSKGGCFTISLRRVNKIIYNGSRDKLKEHYILMYPPIVRVPRHSLKLVPGPDPELYVLLDE
jgi:hypothetical protein